MLRLHDPRAFMALLLVYAALALGACANNPITAAETHAQKAFAISASYNIVLESAADIVEDRSAPLELRRQIQAAEARTTPVVNELEDAFAEYQVIAAEWRQGQTTEERLNLAADNLARWITNAERALIELAAAVKGD